MANELICKKAEEGESPTAPSKKRICRHCGGDLKMRNPTGKCDHLYYPDMCVICSEQENARVGDLV